MTSFVYSIIKLVTLMLIQNGYKVNHYILVDNAKYIDRIKEFRNDYYSNVYLNEIELKVREDIQSNDILVINDVNIFLNIFNLEQLKENRNCPIIINSNFEVYLSKFNKNFKLFEDKQMISMIGLLANLRPYNNIVNPFLPKINIFVIF